MSSSFDSRRVLAWLRAAATAAWLRLGGGEHRFALRLALTVAVTFAVVGGLGYVLLEGDLAQRQIDELAAAQRADAQSFAAYAFDHTQPETIDEIDDMLDAIGRRPGVLEAKLIGPHYMIVASRSSANMNEVDRDPRIVSALEHGTPYTGREAEPGADRHDFELIRPVVLGGRRYVYELTYDHHAHDAQLSEIRSTLLIIGLVALLVGAVVFYTFGGRRLLAEHRSVLQRATRDGLTDLPNQRAFEDELPQTVSSAARYGEPVALAVLDIDDFKLANDRHGHLHGDAVLRRVATILGRTRPSDRAYRLGGDEFALLLPHTDADGARTLARRLARSFHEAGLKISMGVSAVRPGLSADTLRAEADSALYEAKRRGGNRFEHFVDVGHRVVVTTSEKKEAVHRLLEERRLTTLFQPIWSLDTGALLAVEALTRPDPSYGLSGPAEAFDIAEQLGRVHKLDQICVESALSSAPELDGETLLFVNLAPLTLDLDAERNDWLRQAVERAGLAPEQVVVEVTERFGGRTASVVKCLRRLREQGFRIAVDDVGTGNSGLEMLRSIDAEFVKLDRSVVAAAATEPGARAVLMAMATFARQTGSFVIAEGIEDDETLEFLCTFSEREPHPDRIIQGGQGYGLGMPSQELSPPVPDALRDRPEARQLMLGA